MTMTLWLAALAPLLFLLVAAMQRRKLRARLATAGAGLSFLCALGALVSALVTGPASSPVLGAGGAGLALRLDALSATLSALIAFIGLVVVAYSRNYLAGDPRQARFIRDLCLTLALVQGLVLSGNLVQLVACWIGVSLCINRLLLFRGERQAAVLAARKRFIVGRLSDACLIAAAVLLWRASDSLDLGLVAKAALNAQGPAWSAASLLIVGAAVLASAQLPFHGWILEVMETPTPVSALLHAGVVNAGGFLVLRFADVVAAQQTAMLILIVVGAVTAIFGSLVMLAQTSIKVGLAYSTIAQMGFMLLECGLGAFSAVLLHIVAHSLYKAHAFLSAGGSAAAPRVESPYPSRAPRIALLVGGPLAVGLAAFGAAMMGFGPAASPGEFVLASVLLLGLAPIWIDAYGSRSASRLAAAALLTAATLLAYAIAQWIFAVLLEDFATMAQVAGPVATAAAILVVTFMAALVSVQLAARHATNSPAWARAHALAANGFYLNTFANRWALRLWPARPDRLLKSGASS